MPTRPRKTHLQRRGHTSGMSCCGQRNQFTSLDVLAVDCAYCWRTVAYQMRGTCLVPSDHPSRKQDDEDE